MPNVQIGNNSMAGNPSQFGMDAEWLKKRLKEMKEHGKTQAGLAEVLGLKPPQVNKMVHGKRRIFGNEVDPIRAYLSDGDGKNGPQIVTSGARKVDAATTSSQRELWERSVPMYGNVSGGSPGGLQMGNGHALEHVRRPPKYELRKGREKDIFAVRMDDISMSPAFRLDSLVYVDPRRTPDKGDDAFIEIQEGDRKRTLIRHVVSRSDSEVVIEQYTPHRQQKVPMAKVATLCRVMTTDDLLG